QLGDPDRGRHALIPAVPPTSATWTPSLPGGDQVADVVRRGRCCDAGVQETHRIASGPIDRHRAIPNTCDRPQAGTRLSEPASTTHPRAPPWKGDAMSARPSRER